MNSCSSFSPVPTRLVKIKLLLWIKVVIFVNKSPLVVSVEKLSLYFSNQVYKTYFQLNQIDETRINDKRLYSSTGNAK